MSLGLPSLALDAPIVPWSPIQIPSLALWLRADAGVTYDGSNKVSAWADQSGHGRDAAQAVAGAKPTYQSSDANFANTPSLLFDGGDFLLSTAALLLGNVSHALFVVGRAVANTSATAFGCVGSSVAGTRNTSTIGQFTSGTSKWWYDGDDQVATLGSATDTSPHFFGKVYNSATTTVTGYKDGAQDAQFNIGASTPDLTAGYTVGSYTGGSASGAIQAAITDMIILSAVPSAIHLAELARYFRALRGTP